MPPVLHVALGKLAGCRAQQMFARVRPRRRYAQRHHILQLVAKAVGAARPGKSRRAPRRGTTASDTAASGSAGCPWRGRASRPAPRRDVVPVLVDRSEDPSRSAVRYRAIRSRALRASRVWPRKNTISVRRRARSSMTRLQRGAGIERRRRHGRRAARRFERGGWSSVPLRPRNSVRSPV